MIKAIKTVFKILAGVVVTVALVWILAALPLGTVSEACRDIKNSVLQYIDPVAVVKDAGKHMLEKGADAISNEDGNVQKILRSLDLNNLPVVDLPDNAVEKKTIGETVKITLYRDPGYITITYKGASTTVEVGSTLQKVIALM